eukprot:TRINITY_DN73880_c0_g1_i1.p1 TRINITY_DN73880_c0_g1~~TRINITY_DN73880_c0_g1_i1.p1  ORF type:complete len:360 (+),score=83.86 TRINITY_DN73880_c0_g1_i1:50-1081(+)
MATLASSAAAAACAAEASQVAEAEEAMLRVLTFNVRRFKSADGGCSADAVGRALSALKPGLVALNEVDVHLRPDALSQVAEHLGGFSIAFFGHVRGRYGNALLSRFPILDVRETHLRGGTEVAFPPGTKKFNGEIAKEGEVHRIARGLLECDVEVPTGSGQSTVLTVAVTHFDHMSEEQRRVQAAHVLEALAPNRHRALLVGDLNALTRSDYTDQEWSALETRASSREWAPPAPAGCLEDFRTAGFFDAFAASRGGAPLKGLHRRGTASAETLDAGASAGAAAHADQIFTAHVDDPLYRIDYCFVSNASGLSPSAARVHTDASLSDHFPVVFDFSFPKVEARL